MSYKFVIGGHYHCQPDWLWQVKSFPDYDLWLVLNGTGSLTVSKQTFSLATGDCFVFHPRCTVSASLNPSHPLEVIAIHFVPVNDNKEAVAPLHRKLADTKLLVALMRKALEHDFIGNSERADFWLTAALVHLRELDQQIADLSPRGVYDEEIDELKDEMESSPELTWTIQEMAARCKLSNDHFTKIFKASTGLPPLEFVIQARITQAKHDLLYSSLNISQIAERLGYTSVYFFSRQFKQKTGLSPREYRRSFLG